MVQRPDGLIIHIIVESMKELFVGDSHHFEMEMLTHISQYSQDGKGVSFL